MKKLIIFKSLLHDQESVLKVRRGLMAALENWEVKVCNPADYDGGEAVCFIGTGGTEEAFRECFEKLKAPITLLSDSYHSRYGIKCLLGASRGVERSIVSLVDVEAEEPAYDSVDVI